MGEIVPMSFSHQKDGKKFWIHYKMECVQHYRRTQTDPAEWLFEFEAESATISSDQEDPVVSIDHDEAQELAQEHAKKHGVMVE